MLIDNPRNTPVEEAIEAAAVENLTANRQSVRAGKTVVCVNMVN